CAEFCGYQHANMALLIIAEPPAQFEAWQRQQRRPAASPSAGSALRGQKIFMGTTCAMCLTIRGTPASAIFGPDLTHVASRKTIAAATLPNTAAHRIAWVSNPQDFKPGANMPPSELASEDLQALAAYLETLR